jgi:hypothetical protein
MARKKSRQTFEKMKREQAVKERRARKQERRAAARLAKTSDTSAAEPADHEDADLGPHV